MKLLPIKKRKIAVLFTAGLGDTLLFIPLLKALKQKQFHITGLFYSPYDNDCLLDDVLLDEKIHLSTKSHLLLYAATHYHHFENLYINHSGAGKLAKMAVRICSKRITITNNSHSKRNRSIIPAFTDAEQNLHLLFSPANARITSVSSFYLPHPSTAVTSFASLFNSPLGYFVVQVSSGNNTTPFKNWPVENWVTVIAQLCNRYPQMQFVILGDTTETGLSPLFSSIARNCTVLIGKTSVKELFQIVLGSKGYIGLDSGIMHLAVALKKPTFTIFGASNDLLYGYAALDANQHRIITTPLNCRPCSSWKNANTSRVSNPLQCPDYACLNSITAEQVLQAVIDHFKL